MRNLKYDIATYRADKWFVNDRDVDTDTSIYLHEKTTDEDVQSWGEPTCLYCSTSLEASEFQDITDDDKDWHNNRCYLLNFCRHCAYWEFRGYEAGNRCMDSSRIVLVSSVTEKFSQILPGGCGEELAQELRRNPMLWHNLSPTRMETLVADIFRANYHHCEVIHVGAPGDRGVDVVFIDGDGTRWLIQVKRRARPNKTEGFSTLQSILGTLTLEGERHGMIVSTADHFSYQAKRESERVRQRGYIVELLDKGILERMIGALLPHNPWRELFTHPSLDYIDADIREHFIIPEGDPAQLSFF